MSSNHSGLFIPVVQRARFCIKAGTLSRSMACRQAGISNNAIDKAHHRLDDRLGLVALRRVAAISQPDEVDVRGVLRNSLELLHGAVFVVLALDGQYRAGDAGQVLLDVPGGKMRVQPSVVPAAESGIRVGVVARQLFPQVGGFVTHLVALED